MIRSRPSLWLSTASVVVLVALWGVVRLWIFSEYQVPLTYVLPMLLCVWTRRRWQLVGMVLAFLGMAVAKYAWVLPLEQRDADGAGIIFGITLFNIIAGGVVIECILRLRDALDRRAEAIQRQNAELEAQAEELAQQNEEIKAQGEELAQQNEEIESQTEELQRQNEELTDTNDRLAAREEILHAALECARQGRGGPDMLGPVCRRVLNAIGAPAELVALAEVEGDTLAVRVQVSTGGDRLIPACWPRTGSIAAVVLEQGRSAYIDDVRNRPDLAVPFSDGDGVRSVLAAPVPIAGSGAGVLLACSRSPGHWTQDQFRLLEWSAAQCGLILETVRTQGALRDRTLAVESASRAKDEFLATLSHELRTPLSPVLIAVEELAANPTIPVEARSQLEMIRRNVAVQSRLIDDLLDLTRIARGKIDLNHQPIDVRTLLQETAAVVAADLSAKGQTLVTELDVPETCRLIGDAARLQQVFWNLLKNSTKFTPHGGTIRMRASMAGPTGPDGHAGVARPAGQRLIVDVIDSGSGIAPEDIERIFQPFEQAAASRGRGGSGGLGLGLSIARALTELHDGALHACSAGPGRGAVFTVELPIATLPAPAALAIDGHEFPAMRAMSPAAVSGNILLVEDHGDTATAITRVLRGAGFSVVHASEAALAIEHWKAGRFDLLISDLGLPDASGLDVIRAIRDHSRRGDIRAICMSGYGMENDLKQSQAAGFQAHLIKPVSKQQLLAAVHQALDR